MHERLTVGFIGLGVMGAPMAQHIVAGGFPLHVFNRTVAKCDALLSRGAVAAKTPALLAPHCDVIVTMVNDAPDVREVLAGPQGALQGLRAGAVLINMGTVAPHHEREMAAQVAAHGGVYLDAPVSGGDVGARAGKLTIMVGGDAEALQRVRPVLLCMGQTVTHCGPVGSGQATKLCNQILVATNLLGVCEALVFARRMGLDPSNMIDAVSGGAAASWQLKALGPRIVQRDFAPGFRVDLLRKDLRAAMQSAEGTDVALPATGLVQQLLASARAHGDGAQGTQALARVLERLAGLDV